MKNHLQKIILIACIPLILSVKEITSIYSEHLKFSNDRLEITYPNVNRVPERLRNFNLCKGEQQTSCTLYYECRTKHTVIIEYVEFLLLPPDAPLLVIKYSITGDPISYPRLEIYFASVRNDSGINRPEMLSKFKAIAIELRSHKVEVIRYQLPDQRKRTLRH
jgi:hypothetical protein